MTTLRDLSNAWTQAKSDEKEAASRRIEIERQLLLLVQTKEEGSTTTLDDGIKVITTGKLSYKADPDVLARATLSWAHDLQPSYLAMKVDETRLKKIRNERPDLWAQIARFVEIKPMKTGVTVTFEDN